MKEEWPTLHFPQKKNKKLGMKIRKIALFDGYPDGIPLRLNPVICLCSGLMLLFFSVLHIFLLMIKGGL